MNIIPPYLKLGDTIGITCPAGAVSSVEIENMCQKLKDWGFEVKIGETIGTSYYKFSAKDEVRRNELQKMLDDQTIDAILFGRGGYGVVRIIDQLDFIHFLQKPKWLLGYSDITCLHSHLNSVLKIASIHAHMNGGYQPAIKDDVSTQSIFDVLSGKPIQYKVPTHEMNRIGNATGELVGGNLALLSDLVGTRSDLNTDGKILVIEDIGEYRYNIDRMLWQLARADKLNNLVGLMVGGFTDTLDNEIPFGLTEYEIVWEKIRSFGYPVCFDFPMGHQPRNWALKFGVRYSFEVSNDAVSLTEIV